MIHIYTGDGKGKSTAAAGLALRALGAGFRVCFIQLLKDGTSSEVKALESLRVQVRCCSTGGKFTFEMTPEELSKTAADIECTLAFAAETAESHAADMIVIDEFFGAYSCGLVKVQTAERIINALPADVELVLTGRDAPDNFIRRADYVTEMKKLRHPFDSGVSARKGIEF